jgi:hypothetical protein
MTDWTQSWLPSTLWAASAGTSGKTLALGGNDVRTRRTGFVGFWELPDLAQDATSQFQDLAIKSQVLVEENAVRVAAGQVSAGDGGIVQRLAAQLNSHIIVWEVNGEEPQEVARIPNSERSLLGFLEGGTSLLVFDASAKQVINGLHPQTSPENTMTLAKTIQTHVQVLPPTLQRETLDFITWLEARYGIPAPAVKRKTATASTRTTSTRWSACGRCCVPGRARTGPCRDCCLSLGRLRFGR